MSKFNTAVTLCAALLGTILGIVISRPLRAQTSVSYQVMAASTSCPTPTSGVYIECPTTDKGLLVSLNGAAYVPVATGTVTTGVTSFNGRTGAVVSVAGDYTYAQLGGTFPGVSTFNARTGTVSLLKADVLGTGIAAATTVTSTGVTTLQ